MTAARIGTRLVFAKTVWILPDWRSVQTIGHNLRGCDHFVKTGIPASCIEKVRSAFHPTSTGNCSLDNYLILTQIAEACEGVKYMRHHIATEAAVLLHERLGETDKNSMAVYDCSVAI